MALQVQDAEPSNRLNHLPSLSSVGLWLVLRRLDQISASVH